jgi:hypothetical protein
MTARHLDGNDANERRSHFNADDSEQTACDAGESDTDHEKTPRLIEGVISRAPAVSGELHRANHLYVSTEAIPRPVPTEQRGKW